MPKKSEKVVLHRSDRVTDSEMRATSMSLPVAVHRRLDAIAEIAGDVRPTRAELIAALIAEAPFDRDVLETKVMAYRRKSVGDVLPADPEHADEAGRADAPQNDDVVVPLRGPGRPRQGARDA